MARIAIIGTGYVGLTTGACLAHLGHDVTCVDHNPDKIARLRAGICPIVEHGLDQLLRDGTTNGNLRFTTDTDTVDDREFIYLCVPTPQGDDGAADLTYVETAARQIGPYLPAGAVVINKSTVPVGSTHVVADALVRPDIAVVSNPEFLREGTAVADFLHPDRVVVGADDPTAAHRVAALYIALRAPILVTDAASAETIKYASNAYLATKLSFVNAVSAVCEAVGADINDVTLGMGYDRRIGADYLRPGPGWGGSCFGKDTRALIHIAETGGYDFALLRGAIRVNDEQLDRMTAKITAAAGGQLAGAHIGVLGLAFKAGTDDLRDSPALDIARRLTAAGAHIRAYDPAIHHLPDVTLVADAYAAAEGAQVLAVLTEWPEFKDLDIEKLAGGMTARHIVDTRGVLNARLYESRGFTVQTVATPTLTPTR